MTKKQAIALANKLAKECGGEFFVIYDDVYEERYGKKRAWAVCDEFDLDTFYLGQKPIYSTEDR